MASLVSSRVGRSGGDGHALESYDVVGVYAGTLQPVESLVAPGSGANGSRTRVRTGLSPSRAMVATGIEPVASTMSRCCATAAPSDLEPPVRFELTTSPLPRVCSTTEL